MPKTIKIGKSPDNDFVINNLTVSRHHAVLIIADDNKHAILKDLGSKNGTYVNGCRISKEENIDFGSQLRFGSEVASLSSIVGRTRITKPWENTDSNSRTIGRGDNCNIRMNHDDVSSRHALITKRSDGTIYIEDCGSRNGTYVNGERITSKVLKQGDRVTITRNYILDWESIYQIPPSPKPVPNLWKLIASVAAILIFIVCAGGIGYHIWKNQEWDKERIYKEYHNAVCWVYVQYGYKVMVDGKNFTPTLCQLCDIKPSELVYMDEDELKPGTIGAQGTAFFISNDGKMATNLHITRPWLFSEDKEKLETGVNKILALLSTQNPLLSRSQVKIEGVVEGMCIIPDGLPMSEGNVIKVSEVKGYDDVNKDVAIIQTENRELPSRVNRIIDIKEADESEDCLIEGRNVFTIGFPYGAQIALNSNQELKNQVHGGSVTQNRGDYEFGHDAETAGGASGSPILNSKGKLIGIHHAGMTGVTGAQGFNWAIKVKYISDLLR